VNSRDFSTRWRAVRALTSNEASMITVEGLWLAVGFLGQSLFFCRFFIQWIASERKKESVFPVAFWYFSIGGGLILLAYAIHRRDPVFITGQSVGLFVYLRNLYFIRRTKRQLAQAGT
jgi:lipid-A-disaccharide synthase-like uncharacterized protein